MQDQDFCNVARSELIAAALASDMSAQAYEDFVLSLYTPAEQAALDAWEADDVL